MVKEIEVKWLKEKSGQKVGDITKVEEKLAEQLIKKEDVELLVPLEMEVGKSSQKGIPNILPTVPTLPTIPTVPTITTVEKCRNCRSVGAYVESDFSEGLKKQILLYILGNNNEPVTVNKIQQNVEGNDASLRGAIIELEKENGMLEVKFKKNRENSYSCPTLWLDQKESYYNQKKAENEKKVLQEMEVLNRGEEVLRNFKIYFNLVKKNPKNFNASKTVFYIDFMELVGLDLYLADELENHPEDTLRTFEMALEDMSLMKNPRVRVLNLSKDKKISVEQIRSDSLGKLVSISGRVVTLSDVRPQVVSAKFECPSCGTVISVLQLEKKFRDPIRCSCGRRGGFKVLEKKLVDTARLILEDLQEKTDNPHTKRLNFFLSEDLLKHEDMKLYESGTEVEIVGVLKEIPVQLPTGGLSTRFELAVDVSHVSRAEEEICIENLTDEEVEDITTLASKIDSQGLDILTESFAPEIYGQQDIKKALCLQLAAKKNEVGKEIKINKPNILLIGDPGTSKSKLGEYAVSITPGSRRSVGGSASAVGLTGAVVRDDYTGGWRLEPGAAVLAKDFYMIDELNNVKDEDKPRLQELLSEHTITFDKATIHAKLKALSGVLATANPIHGLFKETEELVKQFNLSPPIINRFDLIFVIKDNVDSQTDELIARRMNQREMNKIIVEYSADFLKKFFVYIKEQPNPVMTDELSEQISKIYVNLRKYKTSTLNINPRVHVAFLQLCKASAKIRLSEKVEEKDIKIALDILNKSYFRTPSYEDLDRTF